MADTVDILRRVLELIAERGWTAPYSRAESGSESGGISLRIALTKATDELIGDPRAHPDDRDLAFRWSRCYLSGSRAIVSEIGPIQYWETSRSRTQAHVEAMLQAAITTAQNPPRDRGGVHVV